MNLSLYVHRENSLNHLLQNRGFSLTTHSCTKQLKVNLIQRLQYPIYTWILL